MAAWKKKFKRWEDASSPVDVEEVGPLLRRVFGSRLREGTKHQWIIDVSELVGEPGFVLPNLTIPVRGGQKVLAPYLQNIYRAAELLELYPPSDGEEDSQEETEKETSTHEQDP